MKGFLAAVLETGLRQGDSKFKENLSKNPFTSPGNRGALLAHRPEKT